MRSRSDLLLLLLLFLPLFLPTGCGDAPDRQATTQAEGPPPVILIVLDTTRVDHLSVYGYDRETTPTLEKVMTEDVARFTNMVTASNNTYCSHASLFTGLHVKSHGVSRVHPGVNPLADSFDTLAEKLGDHGYYTMAAISASHINPEYSGFGQGFDNFIVCPRDRRDPKRPSEETNSDLLPALDEWKDHNGDRPLFLFLHYFDAHFSYDPPDHLKAMFPPVQEVPDPGRELTPEGFDLPKQRRQEVKNLSRNIGFYDGEIRRADESLGRVFEKLEELGILDHAILVVTSDHGENLGEKNLYYNHAGLYEQVTRAPLLLRVPGVTTTRTVEALAHHTDVMPTILDAVGVPRGEWPEMEGKSLLPMFGEGGGPIHEEVYSEAVQAAVKMVRDPRHKLIVDGYLRTLLYDLVEDPDETRDLSASHPEKREALLTRLLSFLGERAFGYRHTAAHDLAEPETVRGAIWGLREAPRVDAGGFGEADSLVTREEGNEVGFRFTLDGGESKGLRIRSHYGPLFFDLVSDRSPISFRVPNLDGDAKSKPPSLPILFPPPGRGVHRDKAPTRDEGLVVLSRLDPEAEASDRSRYRIGLRPVAHRGGDRLTIRITTNGRLESLKKTAGELVYKPLASTSDVIRIDAQDPAKEGVFEVSVSPPSALVILEAKLGRTPLSNTEYRIGEAEDTRAYPTTFALNPETFLPTPGSAEDLERVLKTPGFYLWSESGPKGMKTSSEEMEEMLRTLGYLEGE